MLMRSLGSTDNHVPLILRDWNTPLHPERLASVVITFQWPGRKHVPIVKTRLEIHQAREFLVLLDRSMERSREGACLLHFDKMLRGHKWNWVKGTALKEYTMSPRTLMGNITEGFKCELWKRAFTSLEEKPLPGMYPTSDPSISGKEKAGENCFES